MCVEARCLIQYIHFSFHRFCDDENSRDFATVFNYRQAAQLYVAGSGSALNCCLRFWQPTQGILNKLSLKLH